VGRFDQPVRWLLVKPNVHLLRSASLSVARNASAAATTRAVTAPRPAGRAAVGELR